MHGFWRGTCESVGGPGIRYSVSAYQSLMTMDALGKSMAKPSHVQCLSHAVRDLQVDRDKLEVAFTRRQSVIGCALLGERRKRRQVAAPSGMQELQSKTLS
jgi:hypothetical protein